MYLNLFDCSVVVNTIENYTIFVEWISLNRSSIKAKIMSTFGENSFKLVLLHVRRVYMNLMITNAQNM